MGASYEVLNALGETNAIADGSAQPNGEAQAWAAATATHTVTDKVTAAITQIALERTIYANIERNERVIGRDWR